MADKDQVKLRTVDQLHISSVQADTMRKGHEFTTDTATAKSLVDRGLATRVGGIKSAAAPANKAAPAANTQAAAAPRTQAAPAPRNQAKGGRSGKSSERR